MCPAVTVLPQVCWTKYGAYPLHRPYCHEGAVRILLACLEAHANRHKRYIKPLLSVHMDFYVRVGQQLLGVVKRPCLPTPVCHYAVDVGLRACFVRAVFMRLLQNRRGLECCCHISN